MICVAVEVGPDRGQLLLLGSRAIRASSSS